MLLVVCGMHRSGSTLVWQIARHLLDGHPGLRNPRGLSTSEFPVAAASADDLLMAKVHFRPALTRTDFPDEGAKYLYTYRDPRDVVASLYRKGRAKPGDPERGPRNSRLIVRRELRGDAFWTEKADIWVGKYEDFRDDVPRLVRDLAAYLGVSVDDARVATIVADVDLAAQQERARIAKEQGVDDDLRVTSNHITDGREGAWRDTLTKEELVAIEAESAGWLVEHGYGLETQVGRRRAGLVDGAPAAAPRTRPAAGAHAAPTSASAVPLVAAGAFALGALATHRVRSTSTLLWLAAGVTAATAAFRMGRDDEAPADVVRGLLARVRRG